MPRFAAFAWFLAIITAMCAAAWAFLLPRPGRRAQFALGVSRHDIYRLRRQKEILDAMNHILSRQEQLPVGRHLDPEIVDGMSVMEVSLNSDCSHARLKVCIAGDSFQQRQGFSWLAKNTKLLRYRMAQLLRHRKNVPTLSFESHNLIQQAEALMKMSEHAMRQNLRSPRPEDAGDGRGSDPTVPGDRKGLLLV